ncbi:MAG: hypothetical protein M3Q70_03455 [bacterium]|nr:hypothetical protein [bacterium]
MGKKLLPTTHESLDDAKIIERQFASRIAEVNSALNLMDAALLGLSKVSKATGKMAISNEGSSSQMRTSSDSSKWNHASRLGAFYAQKAVANSTSGINQDPHAGKDTVLEAGNTPLTPETMISKDPENFDSFNYHLEKMHQQHLQEQIAVNPNLDVSHAKANVDAAFGTSSQLTASEDQFTLAA